MVEQTPTLTKTGWKPHADPMETPTDMDLSDLRASFDRDGYVVLPSFFSAEDVAELDAMVDDWQARWDELPGRESSEYRERFEVHLKALPISRLPPFAALFEHPDMQNLTTTIAGERFETLYGFAFATPRTGGQGWHKDSSDPDPGMFTLNRLVYTRAYTPEQGRLYILPGSHRYKGFRSVGPNHGHLDGEVAITPTKGMVVLVSSHCAHRVGINSTEHIRVVLNSRVNPEKVPADLCDLPVFRSGLWRHSTQTYLGPYPERNDGNGKPVETAESDA